MKALRLFLALSLLLAQTLAAPAWFVGGQQLHGFEVGANLPVIVAFSGCLTDNTDLTTYTFAAVGRNPDTSTVFSVLSEDSAVTFGVTSLTVDGVAAAEQVDQGGTFLVNAAIYIATGYDATVDVVVTMSEAVTSTSICFWAVQNLASLTARATNSGSNTNSAAITLDVNTLPESLTFGACASQDIGVTSVWTGLTEDSDSVTTEMHRTTAAFTEDSVQATPLGITCDASGAGDAVGVSASFR